MTASAFPSMIALVRSTTTANGGAMCACTRPIAPRTASAGFTIQTGGALTREPSHI